MRTYRVDRLLMTFRDAIDGLANVAEKLDVSWREPHVYAEWECASRGVFDGFVTYTLQSATESPSGLFQYPAYDQRVASYTTANERVLSIGAFGMVVVLDQATKG